MITGTVNRISGNKIRVAENKIQLDEDDRRLPHVRVGDICAIPYNGKRLIGLPTFALPPITDNYIRDVCSLSAKQFEVLKKRFPDRLLDSILNERSVNFCHYLRNSALKRLFVKGATNPGRILRLWFYERFIRRIILLGATEEEFVSSQFDPVEFIERIRTDPASVPSITPNTLEILNLRLGARTTKEMKKCAKTLNKLHNACYYSGFVRQRKTDTELPACVVRLGDGALTTEGIYKNAIEAVEFMQSLSEARASPSLWTNGRRPSGFKEDQSKIADALESSRIILISGAPGSGKTHAACIIAENLDNVLCLAPTGKAVSVLKSRFPNVMTIHMMRYRLREVSSATTIIIDEASMVTLEMFLWIARAAENCKRLIMIGDLDQLPPVSTASVFPAFIRSGRYPHVHLESKFRGPDFSNILRCLRERLPFDKCACVEFSDKSCTDLALEMIERGERVKILAAENKVVDAANISIYRALGHGDAFPPTNFVTTKRKIQVMFQNNNYKDGYFNGEEGIVVGVESSGAIIVEKFNGETVNCSEYATDLKLSYACTIHKFQGSEEENIVFDTTGRRSMMTQQLIYVAMTRMKKKLYICGAQDNLLTDTTVRSSTVSVLDMIFQDSITLR